MFPSYSRKKTKTVHSQPDNEHNISTVFIGNTYIESREGVVV